MIANHPVLGNYLAEALIQQFEVEKKETAKDDESELGLSQIDLRVLEQAKSDPEKSWTYCRQLLMGLPLFQRVQPIIEATGEVIAIAEVVQAKLEEAKVEEQRAVKFNTKCRLSQLAVDKPATELFRKMLPGDTEPVVAVGANETSNEAGVLRGMAPVIGDIAQRATARKEVAALREAMDAKHKQLDTRIGALDGKLDAVLDLLRAR